MSDEYTFNTSDNDVTPESPMWFQMKCGRITINQSYSNIITLRFNCVRDELILNASDNDDAPGSPILLKMEYDSTLINQSCSIINSTPGSNE